MPENNDDLKALNEMFNKATPQGKLEILIPIVKRGFPEMLPEGAKASDNMKENFKLSQIIGTKVTELLHQPENKSANPKVDGSNAVERINNILTIGIMNTEIVKQFEKDTNAKLAELIDIVKIDFPEMLPKGTKASNKINENLKTCQKIEKQFIKLNSPLDKSADNSNVINIMGVIIKNAEIMNEYKLLKDIDLHKNTKIEPQKGKKESVKTAKSLGKKLISAPAKVIKKVAKLPNKLVSAIRGI